jgi:hypothetical protein
MKEGKKQRNQEVDDGIQNERNKKEKWNTRRYGERKERRTKRNTRNIKRKK